MGKRIAQNFRRYKTTATPGVAAVLLSVFFALPVWGRSPTHYEKGRYPIAPVEAPAESKAVIVTATRDHWPDTGKDVVSISVDYSKDGGKTWGFLFGFKSRGGEAVDKTGKIVPLTLLQFPLPDEGHKGRMLRATLEVETPLSTSVTMEFK